MLSNTLLAAVKWLAGYFGQSFALIADAIESTTDIFASLFVLLGIKYSSKPADANHPYGHGRVETLISFIVVGFLIISATVILIESIKNIQTPHEGPKSFTLWVLGIIIIWKEISYQWVMRQSKKTHSSSLAVDAWHHRSDAISSVAAFIGISFALFMGNGYEAADDWAAICAAIFIIYNAYMLFRTALGEIMDEHIYDLIEIIRKESLEVQGIKGTEKCFVRKAGMKYHVDLHARVNGNLSVKEGHDLAHQLKDHLRNKNASLGHVLIHIEPDEETN
jgi:cation diffusion facilitator family transporter